jgi:hypothetical protein
MAALLRVVLLCSLFVSVLRAQTAPPAQSPSKPAPPPTAQPPEKEKSTGDIGITVQDASKSQKPAETRISPKEAEELFKSIDEILEFASNDTGLPIKLSVKREMATREQVTKYVEERLAEDEDQKRLERTELVLKKFGLLPHKFELRPFMLTLLREQIAGFYDAKLKTIHLLDWIPAEAQRAVMAHELTHALQDQKIDLENWMKVVRDSAKNSPDPDNAEIEIDEVISARTALVEGQGMAVLVDYILAPTGRTLLDAPEFVKAMRESMTTGQTASVLDSAPLLLRESLTFPYKDGLGFVNALLQSGGKDRAYSAALANPPRNTHEILAPKDYLAKKPLPELRLPDLKPALGKNYEHYDVGSVGEFDVNVLLKQFADNRTAHELSPEWRGGMYYSGFNKTTKKPVPSSTADLAVLYVSRWSSPAVAQKFAEAYGLSVRKRYPSGTRKDCDRNENCSTWNTVEGLVTVEAVGDEVLVMESFDANTATKLRKIVLAESERGGGTKVKAGNLSMRVAAPIFALHLSLFH